MSKTKVAVPPKRQDSTPTVGVKTFSGTAVPPVDPVRQRARAFTPASTSAVAATTRLRPHRRLVVRTRKGRKLVNPPRLIERRYAGIDATRDDARRTLRAVSTAPSGGSQST